LVLIFISFRFYTTDRFKKDLVGIPDNVWQGVGWGIGLFVFFFALMKLTPSFSIAVPTLPQSVMQFSLESLALGTPISVLILVGIFPFSETVWKASMISALMNIYGLTPIKAIITVAVIFGSVLHLLAYGVVLASAESFGVALQTINSISGLLFTATLFGGLAGYIIYRTKNVLWVAIAHSGINFTIVTTTALAIIQLL